VSWHAQDLTLSPDGQLLPLQVVSGTHLGINVTFQPPAQQPSSAPPSTPFKAAAAAAARFPAVDAAEAAEAAAVSARVGLVFRSWKPCGRGAAVLSFDWSTTALTVDFDQPLPDAYTPHPEDTPERKRIGGVLRNYEPGVYSNTDKPYQLHNIKQKEWIAVLTIDFDEPLPDAYTPHPEDTPERKRIGGVLRNYESRVLSSTVVSIRTAIWVATPVVPCALRSVCACWRAAYLISNIHLLLIMAFFIGCCADH
jgi:hypothetical protein